MENTDIFNIKLKLISISLKLNKLNLENISNIALILGINNNNLNKNELIKLIIEYLNKFNIKNLEDFEKELLYTLKENNVINDNKILNNTILNNNIENESDTDSINKNFNKMKISNHFTKPKKRNYLQMLEDSKKIKTEKSQDTEIKAKKNENSDNSEENLDNSNNSIKTNIISKGDKKNKKIHIKKNNVSA